MSILSEAENFTLKQIDRNTKECNSRLNPKALSQIKINALQLKKIYMTVLFFKCRKKKSCKFLFWVERGGL